MPNPKDLIHETSTTTGTGDFTLSAVNGKVRFSDATYGFGTGVADSLYYYISNRSAAEWEHGTGHMSDADTLVRDTVKASSNSNAKVSFSAGIKDVANDAPAAFYARRTGEFFWCLSSTPPDYAFALDGASLSRSTYAALWAFAQTTSNLAASQGAKTAGQFGPGDGSTTFTLPDLKTGSEFIRAMNSGRSIGSSQSDAIRNITGAVAGFWMGGQSASGAFSLASFGANRPNSGGTTANVTATFDASTVVPTASENRPRSVALLPCIVF